MHNNSGRFRSSRPHYQRRYNCDRHCGGLTGATDHGNARANIRRHHTRGSRILTPFGHQRQRALCGALRQRAHMPLFSAVWGTHVSTFYSLASTRKDSAVKQHAAEGIYLPSFGARCRTAPPLSLSPHPHFPSPRAVCTLRGRLTHARAPQRADATSPASFFMISWRSGGVRLCLPLARIPLPGYGASGQQDKQTLCAPSWHLRIRRRNHLAASVGLLGRARAAALTARAWPLAGVRVLQSSHATGPPDAKASCGFVRGRSLDGRYWGSGEGNISATLPRQRAHSRTV